MPSLITKLRHKNLFKGLATLLFLTSCHKDTLPDFKTGLASGPGGVITGIKNGTTGTNWENKTG